MFRNPSVAPHKIQSPGVYYLTFTGEWDEFWPQVGPWYPIRSALIVKERTWSATLLGVYTWILNTVTFAKKLQPLLSVCCTIVFVKVVSCHSKLVCGWPI